MSQFISESNRSQSSLYCPVEIPLQSADKDYWREKKSRLTVSFQHHSGTRFRGEGFWNGGEKWLIRFLPLQSGRYTWYTESSDEGLNGNSGELVVGPPQKANIFLEHGPIKNGDNGRSFVHYDGTPFFWLGDGLWGIAQQSEESELDEYFAVREKQGFSVAQFNTLLNWESTTPYKREPFLKRDGSVDFDSYNVAYFQYLDIVFGKCLDHQMLAAAVVLWFNYAPGKKQDWYDPPFEWPVFSVEQAYRYGRYLGARYGSYPVAWLISADISDNDPAGIAVFSAAARGILDASFHAPPVSSHVAAKSAYHPAMAAAEWVTFHFIQSGHRKDGTGFPAAYTRAVRKQCRKLPVVNGEMFFEALGYTRTNEKIPLDVIRRAAWESLICGANGGISYGAHGLWCWYSEGLEFRMDYLWMKPTPWREALKLPGPQIYTNIKRFIENLPWYELEEAPDLPIHEKGAEPAVACRLGNGRFVIIYISEKRRIRLTDIGLLGNPAVWYDPVLGGHEKAEIIETQGGVSADPPSWDHDCVLLIGPAF